MVADHQGGRDQVRVKAASNRRLPVMAPLRPPAMTCAVRRLAHARFANGYGIWLGWGSVRFDLGRPDHLGPLIGIFADEFRELGARTAKNRIAGIVDTCSELGISKTGIHFCVELVQDFDQSIARRANSLPTDSLVIRYELSHRWNVGQ